MSSKGSQIFRAWTRIFANLCPQGGFFRPLLTFLPTVRQTIAAQYAKQIILEIVKAPEKNEEDGNILEIEESKFEVLERYIYSIGMHNPARCHLCLNQRA